MDRNSGMMWRCGFGLVTAMLATGALASDMSREEFDWLMSETIVPALPAASVNPGEFAVSNWQAAATPVPQAQVAQPARPQPHQPQATQVRPNSSMLRGLPYSVRQHMERARINPGTMSAFVLRVGDREPLMVHNENIPRTPASVMKLVTTYAALGMLGKNYRWPTEVYTQGQLRNGNLNGNLIIKGYGAPDLQTSDVRNILKQIRNKGIRNFSGTLIFDNSWFQRSSLDPGAFDGKRWETYNAQPDALMYNDRTSQFVVQNVNGRPRVYSSTPARNVRVTNQIRSVRGRCRGSARSPGMSVKPNGSGYTVQFSGRFSNRCGKRQYTKAITEPAEMLYSSIVNMWRQNVGGQIKAGFRYGGTPANARLLYRHHSRPLHQIIQDVNKDSHNLMARQIMLTIAARRFGAPATPQKGQQAIQQWLRSQGLDFPELRIENGSGLSRWSKISARHLGELLLHAYRSPHRQLLMNSMAIAGVDGTMKKRLKNTPVQGRGYFKTGTLRDTRSIAGYVKGHDGRFYIVSILQNDRTARLKGKSAHDALIRWAYWRGKPPHNLASR